MSNWFVYLLHCADETLYCGITTDLKRRLAQHNAGTGAKYTRARTPVSLAAHVKVPSKSDALRFEIMVKKQRKADKISFLHAYTPSQTMAQK